MVTASRKPFFSPLCHHPCWFYLGFSSGPYLSVNWGRNTPANSWLALLSLLAVSGCKCVPHTPCVKPIGWSVNFPASEDGCECLVVLSSVSHPALHCRDGTPELGDTELPCRVGCVPSESHLLLSLLKTTWPARSWPARWLFKASLQKRLRVMCFFLVISSLPRLPEVPSRWGFRHHSTWYDAERSRSFSFQLCHLLLHITELL